MKRHHLPIYGQGIRDVALREASEDSRFGFLKMRKASDDLQFFIDESVDPSTISVDDLYYYLRNVEKHEGLDVLDCVDLIEEADELATEFLISELRRRGVEVETKSDLQHRCFETIKPIEPPICAGTYFVRCGSRVKIGSSKNIAKRLGDAGTFSPYPLELIAFTEDVADEARFHERFERFRVASGGREWFVLAPEILQFVVTLRIRLSKLAQRRLKQRDSDKERVEPRLYPAVGALADLVIADLARRPVKKS